MMRELDKAIAEALGWTKTENDEFDYLGIPPGAEIINYRGFKRIPYYSTDGNAMLELDREMRERGWVTSIIFGCWKDDQTCCVVHNNADTLVSVHADGEPMAKALAYYQALTGKEWVEKARGER